ncbi:hypothetical protein GIX45_28430 [Erwinia sp. CPCC 100877]|nr:hypothetical protein [Erwinia sp. CPCC 100877]
MAENPIKEMQEGTIVYVAKGLKTGRVYMNGNSKPSLMCRLVEKYDFKSATKKNRYKDIKKVIYILNHWK